MASHSKLRTMTPITSETAFSDNMSSSDVEQSVELLQRNIEAYEAAVATMKSQVNILKGEGSGQEMPVGSELE